MIISVPTIMHSGAHVIQNGLFGNRELFELSYPKIREESDKDLIMFNHIDTPHIERFMEVLKEYPVVTCLRHPVKVFESFARREESYKDLPYMSRTRKQCIEQWENMVNIIAPLNPYYIHIDSSDVRDREVDAISRFTGKDLSVDWSIVYNRTKPHPDNDQESTFNMGIENTNNTPQEFIDFYYETQNAH